MPNISDPGQRAEWLRDELDLLLEEDVANAIGVTTQTLATWRCEGYGPDYVKLGKQVFYRRETLRAWVGASTLSPSHPRETTHERQGGSTPRRTSA